MTADFKLTPPGDDPVRQRFYTVARWMDELPPHEPTLEAAAEFLLVGFKPHADGEESGPKGPLAAEGEIVEIDVLELVDDRTAIRGQDGSWTLEPPPPQGAHFFAVRFGPGSGWDSDAILSDNPSRQEFDEYAQWSGDDEDGRIEHIATGRSVSEFRRFRLIDGKPTLELVTHDELARHLRLEAAVAVAMDADDDIDCAHKHDEPAQARACVTADKLQREFAGAIVGVAVLQDGKPPAVSAYTNTAGYADIVTCFARMATKRPRPTDCANCAAAYDRLQQVLAILTTETPGRC